MHLIDYLAVAKKIQTSGSLIPSQGSKEIKIGLLTSFTAKGLKEILAVKCHESGISAEIYESEYNQYAQEMLSPRSQLYQFQPELIILFIDVKTILGDIFFWPYKISGDQRRQWLDEKVSEIVSFSEKIKESSRASILVHNFEVPTHSPYGILENKQTFGFRECIETLNLELRNRFKTDHRVFLIDYEAFCSKIGKQKLLDEKMYYLADIKLGWENMPALCDLYLSFIKPLKSKIRKCIVLDLDNTLWGGVVGEDGFEGIKLGPTPEGRPFLEFQKHLLALNERGVLLAVSSRNNPDDALKVIREHPHMVLREANFASMRISWDDKISSIKSIAEEMNIGLDSLVFIDDDKASGEIIKNALPAVLVVDLPEDPALYSTTLLEMNDLNSLQLTEEDKDRALAYFSQRLREDLKKRTTFEDYLNSLQTVVTIVSMTSFFIPRISQLTQRTNQFNMTTKRYTEEDIQRFCENKNYWIFCASIKDKFADMGITAVVILEKNAEWWRIDSFLMSCRVIGRKIEEAVLGFIVNSARAKNVKVLQGEFIPTKKNLVAADFYKNNGFQMIQGTSEKQVWERTTENGFKLPECVQLVFTSLA